MTTRKEFNDTLKAHIEALKENTAACSNLSNSLHLFGGRIGELASETSAWRGEDNENHSCERTQRQEIISKMDLLLDSFGLKEKGETTRLKSKKVLISNERLLR